MTVFIDLVGHVEYRMFVVVCFHQVQLKNIKTNIRHSTRPNWWHAEFINVEKSPFSVQTNLKSRLKIKLPTEPDRRHSKSINPASQCG